MKTIYQAASSVRNNFSLVIDKAVYDRPQFIQRTRDHALLIGEDFMSLILNNVLIHCNSEQDEDGSYILVNSEIDDLIGTGATEAEAIHDLAVQLIEYAEDYYNEFGLYSRTPNRKNHLPYVIKTMILGSPDRVEEMIVCLAGER